MQVISSRSTPRMSEPHFRSHETPGPVERHRGGELIPLGLAYSESSSASVRPGSATSSSDELPGWVRARRCVSRDCAAPVRWLRFALVPMCKSHQGWFRSLRRAMGGWWPRAECLR